MKTHSLMLVTAALLIGGGVASAQQNQYDSLGSPTPAPNQGVSPNAKSAIPNTGGISGQGPNADANDKTGVGANGAKSETTGSGAVNGGMNAPPSGSSNPDTSGAKIPGPIADD
jgi:hypothetical protein